MHNFNLFSVIPENFTCFSLTVLEIQFGPNDLPKITKSSIFRSRKWRHQNKKKCISIFYHKVSCVNITWKSIKAFLRNARKNSKKKNLDTISLRATRRSSVRLALKIPNYLIPDLDNDIIRSQLSGGIILHLQLITK